MEKLINKLKELIKEDEQIGTSKDMYSWAKQQGVLITRNDASYIVLLLERLAKVANEVPGTLPIFDVSESVTCHHPLPYRKSTGRYTNGYTCTLCGKFVDR